MKTLTPELALQADRYVDEQHEHQARLGQTLFLTFGYDAKSQRMSTQVRNLQQIVCSATRFADIEDFVKNQMGKGTASARDWQAVGDDVLKQLQLLRQQAERMDESPETRLLLRLKLARSWVRAVVSDYLYRVACDQMEKRHGSQ